MYLGDNILPAMTTKRIVLESGAALPSRGHAGATERIRVGFLLRSRESENISSWAQSVDYFDYLKLHFVALTDSQFSALSTSMSFVERSQALRNLNGPLPHSTSTSVSLREILETRSFNTTPVSDLNNDYLHELYHEVEIPILEDDFFALLRPNAWRARRGQGLHLISFMQLDIDEYLQNSGIDVPPEYRDTLETLGSHMVYDKLLEITESGKVGIPTHRSVYYINDPAFPEIDASPYSGPAHYHDREDPGGYIGWMAGAPGASMGPKLEIHRVRNYKIISNVFSYLDESTDLSFTAQTGYPASATGQDHESFIGSVIDKKDLLDQARSVRHRARQSIAENLGDDIGIMSYGSQDTCSTHVDRETPENSYHSTIFGINFNNLLIKNSMFGDIMNFHIINENHDFVNRALLYSEISELKITRNRLSEAPIGFNKVGTPTYNKFESDSAEKILVYAHDRHSRGHASYRARAQEDIRTADSLSIKNRLAKSETPLACLEEIEVMIMSWHGILKPRGINYRQFIIKDYDLFHNIEYGKYTYNVSISLRDGVRWAIKEILDNLKSSIVSYKKFALEASFPVVRNQTTGDVTGNYDFELASFTQEFANEDAHERVIDTAVEAFAAAVRFISGTVLAEETVLSMKNMLSPHSGNLASIEEFLDTIMALGSIMDSILTLGIVSPHDERTLISQPVDISTTSPSFTDILQDSFETNIVIEAFNKSTLLADYSLPEILPFPSLISILNSRRITELEEGTLRPNINFLLPESFMSVSPSGFEVDSLEVYSHPPSVDISDTTMSTQAYSPPGLEIQSPGRPPSDQTVIEISSRTQFIRANPAQRQTLASKISVLRSPDLDNIGLLNKGGAYFAQQLPKLGGSITLGLSAYGANFSAPRDLFRILELSSDEDTVLSDEIKTAICDAAYRGDDRDLFLSTMEDSYKNLLQTRQQLGAVYDKMHNMFRMADYLTVLSTPVSSYEQRFLHGSTRDSIKDTAPADPFQQDMAVPRVVGPDQLKVDLNVTQLAKMDKQSSRFEKKFIVVSMERTDPQPTAMVSVNNTFLLEV